MFKWRQDITVIPTDNTLIKLLLKQREFLIEWLLIDNREYLKTEIDKIDNLIKPYFNNN